MKCIYRKLTIWDVIIESVTKGNVIIRKCTIVGV